jgi:tRNA-(ms[2]io[6]A)-hydroxylase
MVEEALTEPEIKRFYKILWASEAKHGNVFVELALHYFDEKLIYKRMNELLEIESEILNGLEFRAALH